MSHTHGSHLIDAVFARNVVLVKQITTNNTVDPLICNHKCETAFQIINRLISDVIKKNQMFHSQNATN